MKLPSRTGGAAGSIVRANEAYRDAPTPYSSVRRGQDTIHITPDHIRVTRDDKQLRIVRPEFMIARLISDEQWEVSKQIARAEGFSSNDAGAMSRFHPIVLSIADVGDVVQDAPQDQVWQFPMSHQNRGDFVYVGDDYFVAVTGNLNPGNVPTDATFSPHGDNGARVVMIHKDNLDGPYLSSVTRTRDEFGRSLIFHRLARPGRGYDDSRSDILKDRFGANYLLAEARKLLLREYVDTNELFGHAVSVAPLGWLDKKHRYAFAVFGHTYQNYQQGHVTCLIYCTGTRALVRETPIPPPAQTASVAAAWTGGWCSADASPRMFSLGAGKMATILSPRSRYQENPQALTTQNPNARDLDGAPQFIWSTDYGQSFQRRSMTELAPIITKPVTDYASLPQGGHYYPEMHYHIEPVDVNDNFLLMTHALNEVPSGDIPSTGFDERMYMRYESGTNGANERYWNGGMSPRAAYMTLFRGNLGSGAVEHMSGLDHLQLRSSQWLRYYVSGRNELEVPPGTYRFNLLMNGAHGSCTPMLQAYAPRCAAIAVRTLEVTVPPGWSSASLEIDTYRTIDTFLMITEDYGSSWQRVDLPEELVSYNDQAAFDAIVSPGQPYIGGAADPRRQHFTWRACEPQRGIRAPGVAVYVRQHDASYLYMTDRTPRGGNKTWNLRKVRTFPPERIIPRRLLAINVGVWDRGMTGSPSALIYCGDADSSEYPDRLRPAIPKLLD